MNELNDFIKENGGVWGNHPDFITEDWKNEVMNGNTRLGYWEWCYHQVEDSKEKPGL